MDQSVLLEIRILWHFPHCYSLFEILLIYNQDYPMHLFIPPNNLSFWKELQAFPVVGVSKSEEVQLNSQILPQSCTHKT